MRRRIFIRQIITEVVFFGLLHALLSAALGAFFADALPIILTAALIIPYLLMFRARGSGNLAVFLAAHIGLSVWPLLLPALWRASVIDPAAAPLAYLLTGVPAQSIAPLNMCWTALLALCALRSIVLRLKGERGYDRGFLFFICAVYAVIALFAEYYALRALTLTAALWAFLSIAGYLVYAQTARVDSSIDILSDAGKKPAAEIRRFNNSILIVFLVPVALFALLSPWLPLGRVASLLGTGLLSALRALFRFIQWLMSRFASEGEEPPVEEAAPERQMTTGFAPEAEDQSALAAFLEMLLIALINIAIVGAAAAAIAYGLYKLYKRFYATRAVKDGEESGGDEREYIGPLLSQLPIAEALGRLARVFAAKTEAEKTRRAYYKKVRRHIRRGAAIVQSDTAGGIAAKIRPAEDIDELTARYEDARYNTGD